MSFQVDGKEVILLGDMTTHGGNIITASSDLTHKGIKVARVGDMVACPRCKGVFPIVQGSPATVDLFANIARHGDKVACGATLISKHAPKQGGAFDRWLYDDLTHLSKGPVNNIPNEEVCRMGRAVMNDPKVQEKVQEALELTKKNGWEYQGWILKDSEGNYSVTELTTDEIYNSVTPGPKPPGAIGQFHTHTSTAYISDIDENFYQYQQEKCDFYAIVSPAGDMIISNDVGVNACYPSGD